ncbi:MAG: cyclic nucleotide-binding domain-containing protein [Thermoleophilaceae bacterium]|nr:cyclic nucleotide-binding domain-containing protein [Thermoleophilaceae bacterium]
MRTLEDLLAEVEAFEGMAPEHLRLIAGCARNVVFGDGEWLMREGDAADTFFVIRTGAVAVSTHVPQHGALLIETLHQHDLVGWSWLIPPHRVNFDVISNGTTHAIAFDGACLRGKCEQDPVLGYDLLRRFSAVLVERLQRTRLRLIDVYGHVPGR